MNTGFPADQLISANSPVLPPEHEIVRRRVREFALREIAPHADEWDESETFPLELYKKAAGAGVLGAGFTAEYGGTGEGFGAKFIVKEELTRFGSGGVRASLTSLGIGLPPVLALGYAAMREQQTPPLLMHKLLAAGSEDTVITRASSGKTMRQLKTAWSEEWSAEGAPKPLKMPWQDQLVGDLLGSAEEHDIEPLIHEAAGQSVVWCKEISTVKAVVDRLVTEAKQALEKLRA